MDTLRQSDLEIQGQTESGFSANLTLKGRLFAMRKKQFSAEKIVAVLKQAELEMPVADIIRRGSIVKQRFIAGKSSIAD